MQIKYFNFILNKKFQPANNNLLVNFFCQNNLTKRQTWRQIYSQFSIQSLIFPRLSSKIKTGKIFSQNYIRSSVQQQLLRNKQHRETVTLHLPIYINFCMGFGACVECKPYFNFWNTPHTNGMQYSFDGEHCWNGRGDIYWEQIGYRLYG